MAPIQTSYSVHTSSSTLAQNKCCCGGGASNSHLHVPITRRGLFFKDSFFEQARAHFDTAVKQVLSRWSDTDLSVSSNLDRYRQLRSSNLREENQAVSTTTDNTCLKIVIDVKEFLEGEIRVKVVEGKELVVEGRLEDNREGGSSLTCQSFRRHFALPDLTNIDKITSVMSSDGVLTITAPRKVVRATEDTKTSSIVNDIHKTSSAHSSSTSLPSDTFADKSDSTAAAQTSEANSSVFCNTNNAQETQERECHFECCKTKAHQERSTSTQLRSQEGVKLPITINSPQTTTSNSPVNQQHNEVNEHSANTATQKNNAVSANNTFAPNSEIREMNHFIKTETQNDTSTRRTDEVPIGTQNLLPVTRRGMFFNDSFFEDVRQDFQAAVKEVLSKWGGDSFTSNFDDITSYRKLRSQDLHEENQAVKTVEDNYNHKFILDVHDFLDGGEVNVKAVNERELVIEGHVEKHEGNAKSTKCFRRIFLLPRDIKLESVSSVVSADGVLTITAPKMSIRSKEDTMSTNVNSMQSTSVMGSSDTSIKSNTCDQRSTSVTTAEESKTFSSDNRNSNAHENETEEVCHPEYTTKRTQHQQNAKSQQEEVRIPVKVNDSETTVNNSSVTEETGNAIGSSADATKEKTTTEENLLKQKEESEGNTNKTQEGSFASKTMFSATSKVKETKDNSEGQSDASVRRSYEAPILTPNVLPVTRRGMFFNDSFFEDVRQDFQAAVKEVLSKWGEASSASTFDDLTSYRRLRSRDLREENQAVRSTEDEHNHKFIVDVHDFVDGGEINVQAVNDRELVIEGRVEKQEENAKSTKRFRRSFLLPGDIKLESVTSVMSADGVLTITAPKKPPTFQLKEIHVPETKANISLKSETQRQSSEKDTTGTGEHLRGANTTSVGNSEFKTNKVMKEESLGSSKIMNEGLEKTHESCGSSLNRESESSAVHSSLQKQNSSQQTSTVSSNAQQVTSSQVRQQKEHIIPVQVEVEDQTTEAEKDISCKNNFDSFDQSSVTSQSKKINNTEDITVEQEMVKRNNTSVDDKKNIDIILTRHDKQSQVKQQEHQDLINSHSDANCLNKECFSAHNVSCSSSRSDVPITRRGLFFQDSFFQDSLENFEAAVKDVLDKFSVRSSQQDDLTTYRNLRLQDLKTENQAFHVEDTKSSHKVVLDVQDFLGGEIKVGINEDRELVIEGQAERKEGTASASISFLRRFLLPAAADVNGVNAVVSADGVLTVISPKREMSSSCGPLKTSTESKSRIESQSDSGRSWEEKSRQESSEESQGYKSHKVSSSYKAHHQHSSTKLL